MVKLNYVSASIKGFVCITCEYIKNMKILWERITFMSSYITSNIIYIRLKHHGRQNNTTQRSKDIS